MLRMLLVLLIALCYSGTAFAEETPQVQPANSSTPSTPQQPPEWLKNVSPGEAAEMTARRPGVKGEFAVPIQPGSLLLMFDGVDVTQLAEVTEKGFSYKPFLVLPNGSHSLSISAKALDGTDLQKAVSFSTRHSDLFDEAVVNNELTGNFEQDMGHHHAAVGALTTKFEGNFKTESRLKIKDWTTTFTTNLRYLDQNAPLGGPGSPIQKGFSFANWLYTIGYSKDKTNVLGSLGDIQVNETQYTVSSLARRGAMVAASYDRVQVRVFDVLSEQVYGFRGGVGAGLDSSDHIMGLSAGVKLFENRVETKAIYVTGGEAGPSYNIAAASAGKRGSVVGFLVNSDFFENKFKTELEAAFSVYDPDTTDQYESKGSQAYRAKVGGMVGIYSYEAQYERVGREFASIGSMGVQKDKEGVSARVGMTVAPHTFSLNFGRFNDNVQADPLLARTYNYQAGADYGNTWLPKFPFGANYVKSLQQTSDDLPGPAPQIDMDADTITGRVGYSGGEINVNFMTAFSRQNDRVGANSSKSISYSLNPSYTIQNIALSSNLQLNQTTLYSSGVTTDTYTITMDIRSKWLKDKLNCDLAGTYTISKNDSPDAILSPFVDNRNLMINSRIAYQLQNLFGFINPSVGVRGTYTRFSDHINESADREEYALIGVLTAAIPFSL